MTYYPPTAPVVGAARCARPGCCNLFLVRNNNRIERRYCTSACQRAARKSESRRRKQEAACST